MKKLKGFTLIELIVVIAIIGVLAAILVPAMMGWVIKSRVTTYNNNASEICTQLQIAMTDLDSSGVGSIDGDHTLTFNGSSFSLTGATLKPEVEDVLENINENLTDMSHAQWSASITNSTITAVTFTGNDCRHVGGFPVQCPPDFECLSSDVSSYLNNARSGWKTAAEVVLKDN